LPLSVSSVSCGSVVASMSEATIRLVRRLGGECFEVTVQDRKKTRLERERESERTARFESQRSTAKADEPVVARALLSLRPFDGWRKTARLYPPHRHPCSSFPPDWDLAGTSSPTHTCRRREEEEVEPSPAPILSSIWLR